MQTTTAPTPDRRRHGLGPLLARATFPARQAADEFLGGLPCSAVGHKWTEIPPSLRSKSERAAGKIPFVCRRCSIRSGFHAG